MYHSILLYSIAFILMITGCNNSEIASDNKKNSNKNNRDIFPEVKYISAYAATDFVPTLENKITTKKNIIYAPAFLYAWDQVKTKLALPVQINPEHTEDFKLINTSQSFQNSLLSSEYSASVEFIDGTIVAKAFFNKTLPFAIPMEKSATPILFNKTEVEAFGMEYYMEHIAELTQILYYKDDNHFILKLSPKDSAHEIILIKGLPTYTSFMDAIKKSKSLIQTGNNERNTIKDNWKYSFSRTDMFAIPVIKFNIHKNYSSLEGLIFKDKTREHIIETAWQRTAFILNENGAVVESEAVAALDSVALIPKEVHPKRLIFDQPFLVMVKRTTATNPYFVMKVENEELLIKNKL